MQCQHQKEEERGEIKIDIGIGIEIDIGIEIEIKIEIEEIEEIENIKMEEIKIEQIYTGEKREKRERKKEKVIEYGSANYWENRYCLASPTEYFDWLEDHRSLLTLLPHSLNHDLSSAILNIGCGNGAIQEHLYELGYTNIINNDISPTLILNMNAMNAQKGYHKMEYQVMDVTDMSAYPAHHFDLVMDKSTLDALTCSDDPYLNVAKMLQEVYRVLKPNGVYFIVSYSSPEQRMPHLTRPHVNF